MAHVIREVMTPSPRTLDADSTVSEAARIMRDEGIGAVMVSEGDDLCGIVTDRDIAIRAVAEGRDPSTTQLGEICSRELVTLSPSDPIERAIELMRSKAIRRFPVMEGDRPLGIVAIGDLALERDRTSALADISAAPPNT